MSAGDRQLRFGADRRWHPYLRRAGGWDPAAPASADPEEAAASCARTN